MTRPKQGEQHERMANLGVVVFISFNCLRYKVNNMTGFPSKKAAAQDKLEQWDTPSEAFNAWWDSDYDDSTNPYERDSFAYWAWASWQAALAQPAQRPWVGLTPEEILDLFDLNNVYGSKWIEFARAVETKLKEKNT